MELATLFPLKRGGPNPSSARITPEPHRPNLAEGELGPLHGDADGGTRDRVTPCPQGESDEHFREEARLSDQHHSQEGVPMTVRVALAQFSGHIDKNVNVEKAENLARQAAGNGAKVVCFPELCTTIYFCFDRDKKWFETAEPVPGPAVDRLRTVARETGTVIVYPLYENDNGVLYNTAVVIGPDGGLIGKYRKMSIPQILRTVKSGRDAGRRAVLLPARQPRASPCSTPRSG